MTEITHKTPLHANEKRYIIEHLNEEHQDELVNFAQLQLARQNNSSKQNVSKASISVGRTDGSSGLSLSAIQQVTIAEIYQEGVELQVTFANAEVNSVFIQFPQVITTIEALQSQYIGLMQQADKLLGKDSIKLTEQRFILEDKYKVTDNMLRLVLSVDDSVLQYENSAGYAYLFDLTTVSIGDELSREHAYYTLRKVYSKSHDAEIESAHSKQTLAWVDVYLHADKSNNQLTSGGRWAEAVQVGDTIYTQRELPEKVEHLHQGQALLIADETSLPTVARLLELWDNPLAPIIINITNEQADQNYLSQNYLSNATFANLDASKELTIIPIVAEYNQSDLFEKIAQAVEKLTVEQSINIDKVWGAMEAKTVKQLRRLLRDRLKIARADCVLKVYWREG